MNWIEGRVWGRFGVGLEQGWGRNGLKIGRERL